MPKKPESCCHCREHDNFDWQRMLIEHPEAPNLIIGLLRNADDARGDSRWLICVIVFALVALSSPILFEWLSR